MRSVAGGCVFPSPPPDPRRSWCERLTFAAGESPPDIQASALDGDGVLDLAVANANTKMVSILRNTLRQRGFGIEPPQAYGVANFPAAARFAVVVEEDGESLFELLAADPLR